eukprot:Opistho-1_new@79705
MARRTGGRGVANVLQNLARSVERGDYYEAHQMYRTVYFRSMTQKNYDDAISLVLSGAKLLLEKGQQTSGGDLAILLVEAYEGANAAVEEKLLVNLADLYVLLAPSSVLQTKFMKAALSWSRKHGPNPRGDPFLHFVFGLGYLKESMLPQAQAHLVHAGDAGVAYLADIVTKADADSRDVILARIVLQYLCFENIRLANVAFRAILDRVPSQAHTQIGAFLKYLLQAVTRDAAPLFKLLRQRYASALAKDPTLDQLLEKVGKQIFNIAPAGPGGLLGSLMKGLMGGNMDFGFDDDEDDAGPPRVLQAADLD